MMLAIALYVAAVIGLTWLGLVVWSILVAR